MCAPLSIGCAVYLILYVWMMTTKSAGCENSLAINRFETISFEWLFILLKKKIIGKSILYTLYYTEIEKRSQSSLTWQFIISFEGGFDFSFSVCVKYFHSWVHLDILIQFILWTLSLHTNPRLYIVPSQPWILNIVIAQLSWIVAIVIV